MASPCRVLISGCSGGGKSALLAELARRGYHAIAEPGRRIIAEARQTGENRLLPWIDPAAFANRALDMAVGDFEAARGLTFYDRGIVDAAVAIAESGGAYPERIVANLRYDRLFLAPPWPEIYETDEDRRHNLDKALADFERLRLALAEAGYDAVVLPRETVAARADFVLARLSVETPRRRGASA